jgi:hypothetical protein
MSGLAEFPAHGHGFHDGPQQNQVITAVHADHVRTIRPMNVLTASSGNRVGADDGG